MTALKIADLQRVAKEEGREEGAYQNKLEPAQSLLAEGLAPAMVARCTGLPLETVQDLIKN